MLAHLTSGNWGLKLPVYQKFDECGIDRLEDLLKQGITSAQSEFPEFELYHAESFREKIESCIEICSFGEGREKALAKDILRSLVKAALSDETPHLDKVQKSAPEYPPRQLEQVQKPSNSSDGFSAAPADPVGAKSRTKDFQSPSDKSEFPQKASLGENNTFSDPLEPFGDYSAKRIVVTLPAEVGAELNPGEILRLPRILPPGPPRGEGQDSVSKWLEGQPWHALSIGIGITNFDDVSADDFTEMQSEFFSSPETAYGAYKARRTLKSEPKITAGQSLISLGRDLGKYSTSFQKAAEDLGAAILDHFETFEPKSAEFFQRSGLRVVICERLADIIASTRDVEDYFLQDGPDSSGQGGPQDMRGSINPNQRLDHPVCLQRAVMMHFTAGHDFSVALQGALLELRQSQLTKKTGVIVEPSSFDRAMRSDWFMSLEDLEAQVSALKEPEMAP
jgi:hypothetical protein